MILRPQGIDQVDGGGRGGRGVAKLGGSSRQGSLGPRGGGSGSLRAGIFSVACVSGASSPAGTRSGGTEVAFTNATSFLRQVLLRTPRSRRLWQAVSISITPHRIAPR